MASAKDTDISVAYLHTCFLIVAEALIWRSRPPEHFLDQRAWRSWNAQNAGKAAGTPEKKGYLCVTLTIDGRKRRLKAHRITWAMTRGEWPPEEVDHVRGIEAGDGIGNLRPATRAENNQNVGLRRNNRSGFPGVSPHGRKWKVEIQANRRRHHIGVYGTFEQACQAYLAAKAAYHPFAPSLRRRPFTIVRGDIRHAV